MYLSYYSHVWHADGDHFSPSLLQVIDFYRFEETFKLGSVLMEEDDTDGTPRMSRRYSKRPETVSLLDSNRMRNVGECFGGLSATTL